MLQKLSFKPGINKEVSSYTGEGGWYDGNKVRFRFGLPEKIGGWTNHLDETVTGVPRDVLTWRQTTNAQINIVVGTHSKIYIEQGGAYNDITPIRDTTTGEATFDTVNTSTTVTVTDTAHGAEDEAYVTFSGAAAGGGITIDGEYQISLLTDDTYEITHSSAATSTASGTGGGSVVAAYQINPGEIHSSYNPGYGVGGFGIGSFGTIRSTATASKVFTRTWGMDTWGEDLVFTPWEGKVYVWDASGGADNRATLITQAPATNSTVLVSSPDRHLVALGSHDGSVYDPMLVRWCDQEDYTDWTPTATNTSGTQVLVGGSRIIGGIQSRGQILIFTDSTLHSMQYIGTPYTFGFQILGTGCGAVSQNAIVDFNGVTYWMGSNAFYRYSGTVETLSCTVHGYVFDNLEDVQREKCFGFLNQAFDEITWFYPTATLGEPDNYVTYNFKDQVWSIGTMDRTTWVDKGLFGYPLAYDSSGQGYNQEYGSDAAGSAMTASIESADFDIGEGDQAMYVHRVFPDLEISGGDVDITFNTRNYPHSAQAASSAITISSSTEVAYTRIRGRHMSMKIESDAVGDAWRYGNVRIDMEEDGYR
jgi:hypothetical protein